MDLEPWIEALGATLFCLAGLGMGWRCSTLPGRWWLVGYIVPLLLIGLLGLGRNVLSLEFVPPFSWLLAGRREFLLGGICAAWVLATPCSRLRTARERTVLMGFVAFFVSVVCIWPFLAPAFNRSFWQSYVTQIDDNGICIQGTDYSCGPAAAVTALRKLGIPAQEGELAILAHTSNSLGTPSDLLSDAIAARYGADGIVSRHRPYPELNELGREPGVFTLAVIKYGFLVDHYVTVLRVTPSAVVVGDPNQGLREYRPAAFREIWRGTGIEIRRK
ncbi:MAG: hypothetical protein JNN07_05980 [Verrucomicrobiales bacterium]|nr:hypothetical protein [Verrucomicrobiales bacterium]